MVKQDAKQAKAITSLVNKLISRFKPEEPPATDPVVQLVLSFLNWNSSARKTEEAYAKLMTELVDINELRVSSVDQILSIIGDSYPEGHARVVRMKQALREVFMREHALSFASVQGKGKKDQRAYLDSLPGITPYVAAQVTLISFNGHAMPVDEKLAILLEREGCVVAGTPIPEIEAFLMKQVKASDALRAHAALQAWADTSRITPPETTAASVVTQASLGPAQATKAKAKKDAEAQPETTAPAAAKPAAASKPVVKKSTTKPKVTKTTTRSKVARKK